jgi:hypothetical protein
MIVFLYSYSRLPPQIPLLYSKLEGDDQLVDTWAILILPVSSIAILVLLNWLKKRLETEEAFIRNIFDYVGWTTAMGLLLIGIYILLLVT